MSSRPRPTGSRADRSRDAALRAAASLLAEGGYQAVTQQAVATRAGIARTTLSRHWSTMGALVTEVVKGGRAAAAAPDTGDLDTDVQIVLSGMAAGLAETPWAHYLPSLLDAARSDPELAEAHRADMEARRTPLRAAITRAVDRGDLPGTVDVELLVDALAGPLLFRRLIRDEPVDPALARRLAAIVLAGVRARG